MDSVNGGLSSSEKQRQAAAELARRKVLNAYAATEAENAAEERVEQKIADEFVRRQDAGEVTSGGSDRRGLGVSATPVLRTVSNEEWKKYHTAWQQYYQKYYSEYYMNAAKEYVAKTQVKEIRRTEENKKVEAMAGSEKKLGQMITSANDEADEEQKKRRGVRFKRMIQERAREKVRTSRRRAVLTPILMGVAVMLAVLFLQYNRLIFAPIAAYVSPGDSPASEIEAVDPTVTLTKVSSENKLIIPKLNVEVPIRFGVALDDVMSAMNDGVAHYRIAGASAYPGEIGNFVITGHSAGDIYSSNPYKFIFSGLERLEDGDIMYVHYNSVRYTYKMVGRETIEPTEVSKLMLDTDKPMMTLVTCWPLGTSRYRLLIRAEQIAPSYADAAVADDGDLPVEFGADEMPKNEKTFFERLLEKLGW